MDALLIYKDRKFIGKQVLRGAEFVLGRGGDIVLDAPTVSRRHAVIRKKTGRYFIVDLESANGTLLNGVVLPAPNEEAVLRSGDQVEVGEFTLRCIFAPSEERLAHELANAPEDLDPPRPALPPVEGLDKTVRKRRDELGPAPKPPPPLRNTDGEETVQVDAATRMRVLAAADADAAARRAATAGDEMTTRRPPEQPVAPPVQPSAPPPKAADPEREARIAAGKLKAAAALAAKAAAAAPPAKAPGPAPGEETLDAPPPRAPVKAPVGEETLDVPPPGAPGKAPVGEETLDAPPPAGPTMASAGPGAHANAPAGAVPHSAAPIASAASQTPPAATASVPAPLTTPTPAAPPADAKAPPPKRPADPEKEARIAAAKARSAAAKAAKMAEAAASGVPYAGAVFDAGAAAPAATGAELAPTALPPSRSPAQAAPTTASGSPAPPAAKVPATVAMHTSPAAAMAAPPAATPEPQLKSGIEVLDALQRIQKARARLVVATEQLRNRISLEKLVTRVGRTPDNDVALGHQSVSSRHAQIIFNGAHFEVVDQQSTNFTFVDGFQILPGVPQRLESHVALAFGGVSTLFIHEIGGLAAKPRAAPERVTAQLVEAGVLTRQQAKDTLGEAVEKGLELGEILVLRGFLTPERWSEVFRSAELAATASKGGGGSTALVVGAVLLAIAALLGALFATGILKVG